MTEGEAYKLFWNYYQDVLGNSFMDEDGFQKAVDEIYSSIESCSGCKHEPKHNNNEPYPAECGECSRWYSDGYDLKENQNG